MKKEILLYSSIYSFTAADFIQQMEVVKSNDVTLRINTNGGSPEDSYGMIAKWKEHKGAKYIKVDGKAFSTGAYFLCFTDEAECLDVSQFLLHRAAYPEWIESDPEMMTADRLASLKIVNDVLRAALEAKINTAKLLALKGVTLDQIFSTTSRIDVLLTAAEAKEIGLVNRIVTITPAKKAEIESSYRIAALANPEIKMPELKIAAEDNPIINPQQNNNMTLAELKAQHPALYAEAVKDGVTQERDRVGAFMAFVDVDPTAVVKGIKDGDQLSQTTMAEMSRKALSAQKLGDIKADNAGAVITPEAEAAKTAEAASLEAFNKAVKANLKKGA